MKRLIITAVLGLLLIGSAFAQRDGATDFLNRTDEMIADAASMFDSASEEAVEIYNQAVELQANAWDALSSGDPRRAMTISSNARDMLQRAIRLASTPPPGGFEDREAERISMKIERNQSMIDELTPIVDETGRTELIELLNTAIAQNAEASSALSEGNLRLADNLAERALQTINQVRRMLSTTGGSGISPERVRSELERTDAVIAEISARAGMDAPEEILEIIATAEEIQASAWSAFEAGEYTEAINLTNRAKHWFFALHVPKATDYRQNA